MLRNFETTSPTVPGLGHYPEARPFSSLMYWEVNVLFPSTSIHARLVLVEATLIAFWDMPFELIDVISEEPLYGFPPVCV